MAYHNRRLQPSSSPVNDNHSGRSRRSSTYPPSAAGSSHKGRNITRGQQLRRNGACLACRRRRTKCDAVKPHCGACVRHLAYLKRMQPETVSGQADCGCVYDESAGSSPNSDIDRYSRDGSGFNPDSARLCQTGDSAGASGVATGAGGRRSSQDPQKPARSGYRRGGGGGGRGRPSGTRECSGPEPAAEAVQTLSVRMNQDGGDWPMVVQDSSSMSCSTDSSSQFAWSGDPMPIPVIHSPDRHIPVHGTYEWQDILPCPTTLLQAHPAPSENQPQSICHDQPPHIPQALGIPTQGLIPSFDTGPVSIPHDNLYFIPAPRPHRPPSNGVPFTTAPDPLLLSQSAYIDRLRPLPSFNCDKSQQHLMINPMVVPQSGPALFRPDGVYQPPAFPLPQSSSQATRYFARTPPMQLSEQSEYQYHQSNAPPFHFENPTPISGSHLQWDGIQPQVLASLEAPDNQTISTWAIGNDGSQRNKQGAPGPSEFEGGVTGWNGANLGVGGGANRAGSGYTAVGGPREVPLDRAATGHLTPEQNFLLAQMWSQ